jgi:hypothetical protein
MKKIFFKKVNSKSQFKKKVSLNKVKKLDTKKEKIYKIYSLIKQ